MNIEAHAVDGHAEDTNLPEYTYNERYINRELSILDFHLRVLEQAVDPLHPLLERLNFLLIFLAIWMNFSKFVLQV